MKRSLDHAIDDLRGYVARCAAGPVRPGAHVFVYPPEWEAAMLAWLPRFAEECAAAGRPIAVEDVGIGFLREVQRRNMVAGLERRETNTALLLEDLGVLAGRYLARVLRAPLAGAAVCRLLVNTGSLGAVVSYSAVINDLDSGEGIAAPAVLAFPGDDDTHSLNLLGLRADTNYRIPRI